MLEIIPEEHHTRNHMNTREKKAHVLVIGAGVSGLTTALCLRQKGFQVTVVADRFAPQIVSVVAGALWEWPPAVCGHHRDQRSLARAKEWSLVSYEQFGVLARQEETGVFLRPVVFSFDHLVADQPADLHKMQEVQKHVHAFRHDPALIQEQGVNTTLGFQDAYTYLAPMIDTDTYLAWLLSEVQRMGVTIQTQRIDGMLREQEEQLKAAFRVDAMINCSGLGAHELAGDDTMHPLRGALVRVHNDGKRMPQITTAHCVSRTETSEEPGFIFIVPRGKDRLLLGGFSELDAWSTDLDLEHSPLVQEMMQRCVTFLPVLQHAQIDEQEPVRVGLRPFRQANVHLEHEPGTAIIHNYGHAGAGVTFSWGCAREVVTLLEDLLGETVTVEKLAQTGEEVPL